MSTLFLVRYGEQSELALSWFFENTFFLYIKNEYFFSFSFLFPAGATAGSLVAAHVTNGRRRTTRLRLGGPLRGPRAMRYMPRWCAVLAEAAGRPPRKTLRLTSQSGLLWTLDGLPRADGLMTCTFNMNRLRRAYVPPLHQPVKERQE